jgi:ankyrin repeat protein
MLLYHDFEVNSIDMNNMTSLLLAINRNSEDVISSLIHLEADDNDRIERYN